MNTSKKKIIRRHLFDENKNLIKITTEKPKDAFESLRYSKSISPLRFKLYESHMHEVNKINQSLNL